MQQLQTAAIYEIMDVANGHHSNQPPPHPKKKQILFVATAVVADLFTSFQLITNNFLSLQFLT